MALRTDMKSSGRSPSGISLPGAALLQRKCACGGSAGLSGPCAECQKKQFKGRPLQTKLAISEPGDAYEQEADRLADQVMTAPANSAVSAIPLRIQRFAGQTNGQVTTAPPSVDRVLAGSGSMLEPVLRQDMEQRFGHDFSNVRVHSGSDAEQSAREVNARAYTVGHNVVFGAGQFTPGTQTGRRLIAHELTHMVQQACTPTDARSKVIARKVESPTTDARLRQVLIGKLQNNSALPTSTAGYFFSIVPPQATDPTLAVAQGPSPIDTLLGSFAKLRKVVAKVKDTSDVSPPAGEVKLAMSDKPDKPALGMVRATAYHYRWNIEVLLPVLESSGEVGSAAVKKAMEEGRLSSVKLAHDQDVEFTSATPPRLHVVVPCTLLPPDQISWKKTASGKLHIDAGGEGDYPEANNLNYKNIRGGSGNTPIPNLVCANIYNTWPIGDRRADLITVGGSPINGPEMARVIKPGGLISLKSTKKTLDESLPALIKALGDRIKKQTRHNEDNVDIEINP